MPDLQPITAQDLRLYVFNRSVHPELVTAYRKRHLEAFGYQADLTITGPSHMLTFRANGQTFTEIVAPSGSRLPRLGKREDLRIATVSRNRVSIEEDLRYGCDFTVERHDIQQYSRIHRELVQKDGLNSLKYFFAEDAETGLCPFSLVEFESSAFELKVTSIHAFPVERTILRTNSHFECTWY